MEPTADLPRRKTSRGRQKIEIKKVEKENSRYVTFSKRKNGIFKKAAEISALTGAEIAVILFSEHGKVFSYGEPEAEKVINRYLSAGISEVDETEISAYSEPENNFSHIRLEQEREYSRAVEAIEKLKKSLKMAEKNRNSNVEFWWENSIEDSMEEEDLEGYKESLEELKRNVMNRIEAISGGGYVSDSIRVLDNQNEGCLINSYNYNANNYNYVVNGNGFSGDQFFSSFNNGGGL